MRKKPVFALLLAAALCASLATPCAASHYEAFDHPDTPLADMACADAGADAVDAFCARFARDPVGEYGALVALYDEAYTRRELAYVRMCRNTGDSALGDAYGRAADDFDYASDRLCLALSEALEGPEGGALEALMPEGEAEAFAGYEAAGGETLDGLAAETALIREYYALPDDDGFEDAAAELYLRLTALRRAQAADAGYDSFAEYAYAARYAREYDPSDAAVLARVVKSRLAPLYVRCERALARRDMPWDDGDVPSDAEILDALRSRIGGVSPELDEAMEYLIRNGLYCIGDGGELYDGGFTTSLPAYRSAFLFNRVVTRFDAFSSTVHEFGHFNAAYHDPTPMLYQYANTDLSELQSQGLELLFLPALQDILAGGDEGGRAYVALYALARMLSGVIDGCLYDEFEQAAYADPALTAEGLFALEQRLFREYGLDALYEPEPFWPYIPHLFDQPFYYVSYATSALPALDLWLRSREDYGAAANSYLNVSAARTDAWFLDVLHDAGLCDVTDRREVEALARSLERELGALLTRRGGERLPVMIGGAAALAAGAWLLRRRRVGAEKYEP